MNERKSKKMTELIQKIKKIIFATVIVSIITYMYACFWFDEQADKFVE
jgi:hypothetical protein